MTIRVHVHGASGRMGSACVTAIEAAADMSLCGTTGRGDDLPAALAQSQADVMVEFTVAAAAEHSLRAGLQRGLPVVSGTTGLASEVIRQLGELAIDRGVGLVLAPNFAVGVLLMQRFARDAVRWLPNVEILELHHEKKLDAPSGTALHTARQIAAAADGVVNAGRADGVDTRPGCRGVEELGVPIHSIRLPGLLAHQEVIFGGEGQVLTLRHDTLDRSAFMPGVLLAIRRIRERRGLVDTLEAFLSDPPRG